MHGPFRGYAIKTCVALVLVGLGAEPGYDRRDGLRGVVSLLLSGDDESGQRLRV